MKELTQDDLYEIEKALDIYASIQVTEMNRVAQLCINWEAFREESPIQEVFLAYKKAYDRIKEIRDKLKKIRFDSNAQTATEVV